MSLVRIVEQKDYNEFSLKDKLLEVLDWVDFSELEDKKILIFFDNPIPNFSLLKELKEILTKKGADKVEFGTSLILNTQSELIPLFKENDLVLHNFRDEPYEEITVDLKSKKSQHYFGYQILSPAQYQTEKAFENSDIFKVRTLKKVFVPESIASSDLMVFVTKIKDSPVNKIGGFINSLLYVVPTNLRSEILLKILSYKFADALLDVYGVLRKSILFGLVDAIEGNLTNDEDDKFGLLLSSRDLIALDSVISVILGFRSSDIESNKMGSIYDLGHGLLKEVVIDGVDFIKIRKELVKKLKFNRFYSRKSVPKILEQGRVLEEINLFCPTGAIEKNEKQFYINNSKCIKCNFCVELAPKIFSI